MLPLLQRVERYSSSYADVDFCEPCVSYWENSFIKNLLIVLLIFLLIIGQIS